MDCIQLSFIQKIVLRIYYRMKNRKKMDRLEEHKFEIKWIKLLNRFGIYCLTQGYYPFKKNVCLKIKF